MTEWFESILPTIRDMGAVGYVVLFAATFGESFVITGIFVPGTIILLIMGGLIPYGYYDALPLGFFAYLGAVLGNAVSYEGGRLGRLHVERLTLLKNSLSFARSFFQKHGGKSIILCRFIGPVRPLVPFIAGITEMKRSSFYAYSLIGGVVWIASYLGFGYVFGYAWQQALTWSSATITVALATIVIVLIVLRILRTKVQQ